MSSITKSDPFLPTEKKVGEAFITYSLKKHHGEYALTVSSTDLSEGFVFVENVTRDRFTAERIKEMLAENLVSPLHVLDVFDSILASF